MLKFKLSICLLMLNSAGFITQSYSQPSLQFTKICNEKNDIYENLNFSWEGSGNVEYRYKLNMPGDWLGGIQYNINKWSEWGYHNNIVYSNCVNEGKYSFVVEARLKGEKQTSRIKHDFEVYFLMPEIRHSVLNIDWQKVYSQESEMEKFGVLAAEYKEAHQYWMQRYEIERRKLNLTYPHDRLIEDFSEVILSEGGTILMEWANKGITAKISAILTPKTLYEIVRQAGLNMVLIYRNMEANTAAFNTLSTYWAYNYYNGLYKSYDEITTVYIGDKNWMTKNLSVDQFRNGDKIYHAQNLKDWQFASDNKIPAWCYPEFDEKKSEFLGNLYNYHALVDARKLAPRGYRISTFKDFDMIISHTLTENNNWPNFLNKELKDYYEDKLADWKDLNAETGRDFNAFPVKSLIYSSVKNEWIFYYSGSTPKMKNGKLVFYGNGTGPSSEWWIIDTQKLRPTSFVLDLSTSESSFTLGLPKPNSGLSVRCVEDK